LYLLDQGGAALNLLPFVTFETCPFCAIQETFFLEQTVPGKATYHTVRANHRIEKDGLVLIGQAGTMPAR
jgi:hypothetical protein